MQQFLDPSPRIDLITTWCILAGIRWEGIFLDGNFSGVNYPWWKFSGWQLSWAGIFRVAVILGGYFPGGNCLGENYCVGIIWVAIFRVGVFMLLVLSIIFFFSIFFLFFLWFYFHILFLFLFSFSFFSLYLFCFYFYLFNFSWWRATISWF